MRIVDEALLDRFRGPGRCEFCKRWCKRREPHHITSRGQGGAFRLDVPINLVALGGAFDCNCHGDVHRGNIQRHDLLAIVAAREGRQQDEIVRTIRELRNAPTPKAAGDGQGAAGTQDRHQGSQGPLARDGLHRRPPGAASGGGEPGLEADEGWRHFP